MTAHASTVRLLTLHAVRLGGVAETGAVAGRFSLDLDEVSELLEDFRAHGWVSRATFGGSGGWSLTEAGRAEDEDRLAAELAESGARAAVAAAHRAFLPLNERFLIACTRWQIRPVAGDAMAANDHLDFGWDDRVLDELGALGRRLEPISAELARVLVRFGGYADRYAAAMGRVERGQPAWVDGVGRDSCHRVWFELHEDLLATLGIARGEEAHQGS